MISLQKKMNIFEKIRHYAHNNGKSKKSLTIFSKIFVFLISFLFAFLVLYFIFEYFNLYYYVSLFFSYLVYNFFSASFQNVTLVGTTVDFSTFQINITDVCSGAYELIVFISLIFACFEIKLWKRVVGILGYILAFVIFNLVRIVIVIYSLGILDLMSVDILHTVLFKFGFWIFTLLFFVYFLIFAE